MIYIGIDPGTHTGIAVWDSSLKKFHEIATLPIHKAMNLVEKWETTAKVNNVKLEVIFEDARKRKTFRQEYGNISKLQGAGSIKRDCSIWEDFLTDLDIPFQSPPPSIGNTKPRPEYFTKLTGWKERTSNHARDAAMIVFGR